MPVSPWFSGLFSSSYEELLLSEACDFVPGHTTHDNGDVPLTTLDPAEPTHTRMWYDPIDWVPPSENDGAAASRFVDTFGVRSAPVKTSFDVLSGSGRGDAGGSGDRGGMRSLSTPMIADAIRDGVAAFEATPMGAMRWIERMRDPFTTDVLHAGAVAQPATALVQRSQVPEPDTTTPPVVPAYMSLVAVDSAANGTTGDFLTYQVVRTGNLKEQVSVDYKVVPRAGTGIDILDLVGFEAPRGTVYLDGDQTVAHVCVNLALQDITTREGTPLSGDVADLFAVVIDNPRGADGGTVHILDNGEQPLVSEAPVPVTLSADLPSGVVEGDDPTKPNSVIISMTRDGALETEFVVPFRLTSASDEIGSEVDVASLRLGDGGDVPYAGARTPIWEGALKFDPGEASAWIVGTLAANTRWNSDLMLKFSARIDADASHARFDNGYTGFFGTFDVQDDDEDRDSDQRFFGTRADDRFLGYGGEDDFLLRWGEDRANGGADADRFIFDKSYVSDDVQHRAFDLNFTEGDQISIRRFTDQTQIIDRQEELGAMVTAGAARVMGTNGDALHVLFTGFDEWGQFV